MWCRARLSRCVSHTIVILLLVHQQGAWGIVFATLHSHSQSLMRGARSRISLLLGRFLLSVGLRPVSLVGFARGPTCHLIRL